MDENLHSASGGEHGDRGKIRTIVAYGVLDAAMAASICGELALLEAESEREIRVMMSLSGDDLDSAFAIFDTIRSLAAPVTMVGSGQLGAAGLIAFIAAGFDDRSCLPATRFHLREPRTRLEAVEPYIWQLRRQTERMREILAEETGQSLGRIEKDLRNGVSLEADEALAYGLVSKIIR